MELGQKERSHCGELSTKGVEKQACTSFYLVQYPP